MSAEVDNTERHSAWPATQWHPAYASVKDWLDNEAPHSDVEKPVNAGKYTVLRKWVRNG